MRATYTPTWLKLRNLLESKEGKKVLNMLAKGDLKLEDTLGQYWSEEIDRIKEKDLLKLYKSWWGDREKAKSILQKGRSEQVQAAIQASLGIVKGNFCKKIVKQIVSGKKLLKLENLKVEVQPSCNSTTVMETGTIYKRWVSGSQQIVGTAYFNDHGIKRRFVVFHRFISHPFWQHVGRKMVNL